jgi:Niemann-Pick C1 protein
MFLYVSLSLGSIFPLGSTTPIRTKFFLGFSGVMLVLCSIVIATGFLSLVGVKATLIISEVIPFLVLAIGVDNIFILVNAYERSDPELPIQVRIAESLSDVGPSITLASLSECFAFLLGALTKMPAVQAFALYSSVAVFADYILQITCFVALMYWDARRFNASRVDCMPVIKIHGKHSQKRIKGVLHHIFKKTYAPILRRPVVKAIVVCIPPLSSSSRLLLISNPFFLFRSSDSLDC